MAFTVGIELSTRPRCTGVCVLEWSGGRARVEALDQRGYDDDLGLLRVMRRGDVEKVAIDAPFGWPTAFTAAIATFAQTGRWEAGQRKEIVLRDTDRNVRTMTNLNPLSVAAEKIAHPAIRCAELLTALSPTAIDRTGSGLCAEVYPAAALKRWELPHKGYKTGNHAAATRTLIVDGLAARARWLDLRTSRTNLIGSDHLLDALLCAILARAIRQSLSEPIREDQRPGAEREGWIHLPVTDALERLP
jgi:hypothetical protein